MSGISIVQKRARTSVWRHAPLEMFPASPFLARRLLVLLERVFAPCLGFCGVDMHAHP
jgi:hypothetical protein